MKKKILLPVLTAAIAMGSTNAATIEERLSELELKQDMNILKFGGRFFSSYDNVQYQSRATNTAAYTSDTLNLYRMQFSLNLDADVSQRIKFYGRYTTSKYFNHFHRNETTYVPAPGLPTQNLPIESSVNRDLGITDSFDAGPAAFLERAYFNYSMNDYLTFSVGRLPTVDGPPLHWEDNVSREGTYAHLAYSNVLDGAAVTTNLSKLMPEGNNLSLRFILTPFSNVGGGNTAGSPASLTLASGGKLKEYSSFYTGMVEYSLKGKSFGDILVLGQVLSAKDLVYLRATTAVSGFPGEVIADYKTYSLYTDITNIMNLGLDFSVTGFISETKNTSIVSAIGGGAFSAVRNATHTGKAFLLTTRYNLPIAFLKNPNIGVEYINGDKYFNKADNVSKDVVGFYTTRGHGLHFYYTQPIETGLKMRIGYMQKTDKYARGFALGEQTPAKNVNNKADNIYAQIRLDF